MSPHHLKAKIVLAKVHLKNHMRELIDTLLSYFPK